MVARKRATLRDVSSQAGVSVFTASRALSGGVGVAEQTQALVRDVARRIGYVANQHARNLKGSRSTVVGVLAASKANQYYATLVGGLEDCVEARGFSCFVADAALNGTYLPAREERIVESFIQQRVAAVVATYALGPRNLALLAEWGIPVLFVDCLPPEDGDAYASVTTDNFAASRVMGQHLAALGYRRWCFVGHASNWNTREPRQRGFEAAAAAAGASVRVLEGGNDAEVARRAVVTMLAREADGPRPSAIFASNTILLKGVMLALADCGLTVPTDMAVVAFDDFDWAPLLSSPVTVIDQHIALIGRTAGDTLLAMLDETAGGALARRVTVAATLRVRESCGCRLPPDRRPGTRP